MSVFVILALLMALAGAEPVERVWTNQEGKTVNGTLSGIDGATVSLRLSGSNRSYQVAISSLSDADQAYIRQMRDQGYGIKAGRWPAELRPMLNFTPSEKAATDGSHVYATPNYRFVSDIQLSPSLIKEYSLAFEGTYFALKNLPLGLNPSPPEDGAFVVRLFKSRADYLKAGGPEGSGGVYMMRTKEILVPMTSLGVRDQGNRVAIDRRNYSSGTLVHEITHQVMHHWMDVLPVWFVEGMAEYMSAVPMKDGLFSFRDMDKGVTDYLENDYRIGKNSKSVYDVDIVPPSQLMGLSHQEWLGAVTSGQNGGLNYRSAMLLVFYFIHLESGQADASSLVAYLQNARGKSDELRQFVTDYNQAVDAYNAQVRTYREEVAAYNTAVEQLRREVDAYNQRVVLYNQQLRQGLPESQRVKVGPEPVEPIPPKEPVLPQILKDNPNGGGSISLASAELDARKALYKNRSDVELLAAMQSAFAQMKINLRPVQGVRGAVGIGGIN